MLFPLEFSFSFNISVNSSFQYFCLVFSLAMLFNDICSTDQLFNIKTKKTFKFFQIKKIIFLLFNFLAVVPFIFSESNYMKLFFVFKYSSFSNLLDYFLKDFNFRNSTLIKLVIKFILAVHICTNSWIFFLYFEKNNNEILCWIMDLNLNGKPFFAVYIYSIKWAFHVFFPICSVYFKTNNEWEILFELLSIMMTFIFLICNFEYIVFLCKDYFNEYKVIERMDFIHNLIKQSIQHEKKQENIIYKSFEELNKNKGKEKNEYDSILQEFNQEFNEEFKRKVFGHIIFEKIPFFFKNFPKEFLIKTIRICQFKSYFQGDEISEVCLNF